MNEVNVLAPEKMIEPHEAVYNELIFNDSALFFMNPNTRSEEAFFGDNNLVKMGMISHIADIREIYSRISNAKNDKADRKKALLDMEEANKRFGRSISGWFNIEKCYVGVFSQLNAFAYPMMWDENLVKTEGKTKSLNKNYMMSLEDIVETKNGFKFKSPNKKIFIIGLGCGFFDYGYTDEEIAGVMLHEVGHCFQQMLVGINANVANTIVHSMLLNIHAMLDPFFTLFTFGMSFLLGLCSLGGLSEVKEMDEDELAEEILTQELKGFERDKLGKEIEESGAKDMKQESKNNNIGTNILGIIGQFIIGTIVGIFKTGWYLIAPIWRFINPLSWGQRILELANINFLRENKKYEQFADMFATNYGLGKQLGSALAKLGKAYHRIDLHSLNWLNYVPVLNVAINLGFYTESSIGTLLDEHPGTKERVVAIYRTCKYEIEHNTELTSQQKKELQAHIEELHKVYEDYVFDLGPRNFVYGLWKRITQASLENEKSDVEANVLSVLKEKKKEEKLKQIVKKEPTKVEGHLKIAALVASCGTNLLKLKREGLFPDLINRFEKFFKK
jgi:Zn-dependent protease with chaperone function